MKVCDKCKKPASLKVIKFTSKDVELCSECENHIIQWLDKPLDKEKKFNIF